MPVHQRACSQLCSCTTPISCWYTARWHSPCSAVQREKSGTTRIAMLSQGTPSCTKYIGLHKQIHTTLQSAADAMSSEHAAIAESPDERKLVTIFKGAAERTLCVKRSCWFSLVGILCGSVTPRRANSVQVEVETRTTILETYQITK